MSPVSATYWGIPGYVIFWALFAIAFGIFIRRVYFLIRLLGLGKPENRFDQLRQRIIDMLAINLSQWCSLKTVSFKDLSGIGHALMFWGFGVFLIGYVLFMGLREGFGISVSSAGSLFEKIYLSLMDLSALLIILAVIQAAIKRYVTKPERLERKEDPKEALIENIKMISLFTTMILLMLFYYWMEGIRYAFNNITTSWPPITGALASFLAGSGISQESLSATYKTIWWLNYLLLLGAVVYTPHSKHLHPLFSSANILFKPFGSKVVLEPIPLEALEAPEGSVTLGVSKIQDFSWKQLLDLYACTWCGRCHVNCPAQLTGKTLSPREIILNLKEHLMEAGPELLANKGTSSPEVQPKTMSKTMIGDVVAEEEIWACTTCAACQEVCPSNIEHIRKVIELRRNLVLEQSKMPESAQLMLRNMQQRGHPWAGVQSMRLRGDWTSDLDIKVLTDGDSVNTLFWVGCTGALVERNVKATLAMTKVLKASGVDFGVLGDAETCCGDPARRAGYEFQFQMMAEQNIEMFKSFNIKEIITTCPHCFNTMKHEYPKFGGDFKVVHYTELIADFVRQGKLNLTQALNAKLTYHDPCYLGRYNGIYHDPRQILEAIPKAKLEEMERSKEQGFCCGGGGGLMWIEEQPGTTKISHMRIEEVHKSGVEMVVSACPYCLQMFEDAIDHKGMKESLKARDIVELVEESMKKS
ncbi:MAG: 4Fe-4S dicluster domain-containing protein [Deltaproteobacteria bacterium]|nr:4Fe-4S dicluster domain-containing protein [Deltaproteobacteria bacterium]